MKVNFSKLNLVRFFNLEKFQKTSIVLIVVGIFVVLNLLVAYFSLRVDLSSGKIHTLSKATKNLLHRLDDIVTIKVFLSSDLPLRLVPLKTDVVDLVNEYKKQQKKKIIVKILDPKKDSEAADEARAFGVPELQFSQIEKDKYAVSATYFGIGLQYADKKEIIPQATNLESLEYDLTSVIFKMTNKEATKIGVLGASQSVVNPREDEFYTLKRILSQQFEVAFLDNSLEKKEKIDPTVKTLLVFDDNEKQYRDDEVTLIKDYLADKGKAIFMVDAVNVGEGLLTSPTTHNLFPFFEADGISLNKDFILSMSAELASFTTGTVSFFTPYPFWVKTGNFDEKAPEFSNLAFLVFPWVSSVTVSKKEGVETKVLVKSEKKSWQQKDNFVLSPNNIPRPSANDFKEFDLVVEAKEKNGGRFTLIPSSRLVKEQFLQRGGENNLGFLINLINNYASGGALAGIRARSVAIYPLSDLPEGTKDIVKYLNIFLLPGLFAILGAARLVKRR